MRMITVTVVLLATSTAHATWSIVLCNRSTKEVGIASVTCLTSFDLRAITPVVLSEIGAAAVQAAGDFDGIRRPIIWEGFLDGTSPPVMLTELATVPGHLSRQYGIVDTLGRRATFTGASTFAWAGGVTGLHGDLAYALQGNILTGGCVVAAMEDVILNSTSDLPGILMEAMEAARAGGGDGRCSCSPAAATACGCPPASFTKSGHIGYLIVSRAGDIDDSVCSSSGCADGDYFVNINVPFQSPGASDPVLQLQSEFDAIRAELVGRPDAVESTVVFDGGGTALTMTVALRDHLGDPISVPVLLTVGHAATSAGISTIGTVVDLAGGFFEVALTAAGPGGTDVFQVTVDDGIRPVVLMPRREVCVAEAWPDCNLNGVADACDISDGTSSDVDLNGVPDECDSFRRGDCNADTVFDIADAIFALEELFGGGGAALPCERACDTNDDGELDIADPVTTLSALFSAGPDPAPPFPACGTDPTPDGLVCTVVAGC